MNPINETNKSAAQVGDRQITITRVFDARSDLVFEVWSNDKHLSKWWGP